MATRMISEQEKHNMAMRLGGQLYAQGATQDQANITYDNFEIVQGRKANDEEMDTQLMMLLTKFFKIQIDTTMHLTVNDLFVSTDFRIDDIKRRLLYLANRGSIEWIRTDVFKIMPKGFDEVESREKDTGMTKSIDNRYFHARCYQ